MGIIGEMGTGKTLAAVYFALRAYWKDRTIYSNIKLCKMPYRPIASVEDIENMKEGFFLGDENYIVRM